MASSSPDSILSGLGLSSSQNWATILNDLRSPLKLSRVPSEANEIRLKSKHFWDLEFSSKQTNKRFGDIQPPPTSSSPVSAAFIPNGRQDAVFGLVSPSSPPTGIGFREVRERLSITPESTPLVLASFFNTVDPNGLVPLKLDITDTARSGLWAFSGDVYRTTVILIFQLPTTSRRDIREFIKGTFGVTFELLEREPRLLLRFDTTYILNPSGQVTLSSSSNYQIEVDVSINGCDLSIDLADGNSELRISNPMNSLQPSGSIFDRLSTAFLNQNPDFGLARGDIPNNGSGSDPFNALFPDIKFWYLTLGRDLLPSQSSPNSGEVLTSMAGPLHWKVDLVADWQNSINAVVALQYDSITTSFSGRLLFNTQRELSYATRMPDYNWHTSLSAVITRRLPDPFDLWKFFSPSSKAPPKIPSKVVEAGVVVRKLPENAGYVLSFSTLALSDSALPPPGIREQAAPEGFSWDVASLSILIEHSTTKEMSIALGAQITLKPKPQSTIQPAYLSVDASLDTDGSWLLRGRIFQLSFPLLYSFLHPSVQDSAIGLLGGLILKEFEATYTYSNGEASSFFIGAKIMLGDELELDLRFEHASSLLLDSEKSAIERIAEERDEPLPVNSLRPIGTKERWNFTASLSDTSPASTLGKILLPLIPVPGILPEFVRNVKVNQTPGSSSVKLVLLGFSPYTAVVLSITLGKIGGLFIMLQNDETKRSHLILRVTFDELPFIGNAPLVRDIPQPFDRLIYLWLDKDLVEKEFNAINSELQGLSIPRLDAKASTKDPDNPLIKSGHHFMVLSQGQVVVDHSFSDQDAASANQNAPPEDPAASDENGPTKGATDKSLPLISISALSLMFKNGIIGVEMDATVKLGPIAFSLLDFGFGISLASIDLENLGSLTPEFSLNGLAVSLNTPPVTLDGIFIREIDSSKESYRGGISLGFQTWKFLAVGEYAIIKDKNFKCFFVYAKLRGPLISLGFATVTRARIGLGYNSSFRSPAIGDLPYYPLLIESVDADTGDNPIAIIDSMTRETIHGPAWVSPKEEAYWLAAGLTLTAFGLLSVTAVLMFQLQKTGFIIGVYANGIAQVPMNAKPEVTLFYVEIGMLAELNTIEGYFTVQAALAPSSHVLVPACRLTGGFALSNWFAPSPYRGDFVFTVGGYHRAFTPPAWYPKVERVGVSFTLESMINVTGGLYFALTPKCVMGGGALHFGLDVGPVSAWLDIAFDVFVQFKPFFYMADLMVSVGCAISIKVWFIHVRIKASVGAALHIEGPDKFGGSAIVDFYLFSFKITFGGPRDPPPMVSIFDFYEMVRKPGPDSATSPPDGADPMLSRIKFTLEAGLYPQPLPPRPAGTVPSGPFPDSGPSNGWIVKPGQFSFSVICDVAISRVEVFKGENDPVPVLGDDGSDQLPLFYAKPMLLKTTLSSVLQITIRSNQTGKIEHGFTGELILRALPSAVWGLYDEKDDPSRTTSPKALRDTENATMTLCTGVKITSPYKPENLISSRIQPFDPSLAFRTSIKTEIPARKFSSPGDLAGPAPSNEELAWKGFADSWEVEDLVGDGDDEEGLLGTAAHWLGWNNRKPGDSGNKKEGFLTGRVPELLLRDLEIEYPILPRTCTGRDI